jgi:hypothetical protein
MSLYSTLLPYFWYFSQENQLSVEIYSYSIQLYIQILNKCKFKSELNSKNYINKFFLNPNLMLEHLFAFKYIKILFSDKYNFDLKLY